MNRKISLGAAIAFVFIVAAATFSMTMIYSQHRFNARMNDLKSREVMYDKFTEIDRQVRINYIGTVNETRLMDSVAKGYIEGMGDKYAMYISAEEYAKLTGQNSENENVGIGVVVEPSPEGYLLVTEVYADSPAQVAGMEAGDLIVKIDDMEINAENAATRQTAIIGHQGTQITLVVRKGSDEHTMEMTRRTVVVPSVYSRMIPDSTVGYIQIREFNSNTSDQFNRELDRLISQGADSLIFDLRDNGGGVMKQATRIIDRLVPAGPIYTARRKDGSIQQETSDANELSIPMVVLTNAGTASASELFAQALRDYDKARIVGAVTAGKGVMQDIIRLSDGSAIEVTVAYFDPPKSSNFNEVGVVPDYEVAMEEDWTQLDHETDAQLKKAVEIVQALNKAQETPSGDTDAASE